MTTVPAHYRTIAPPRWTWLALAVVIHSQGACFREFSLTTDSDGDGYNELDGDCQDHDDSIYPGAPEGCNGYDNDCDGVVPDEEFDFDEDGYRGCDGDCDDGDPDINPEALDAAGDGIDQDCDGSDECLVDGYSYNTLDCAELWIDAAASDLSIAGDLDGDGLDDLFIASYDSALVYLGPLGPGDDDVSPDVTLTYPADVPEFSRVSTSGDVDGDGADDMALGSPHGGDDDTFPGVVYVLPLGDQAEADIESHAVVLTGEAPDAEFGYALAISPSINGDEFDDLVVGAPDDEFAPENGSAFVFFGPITEDADAASADVRIRGLEPGGEFGWSLAVGGDLDADGVEDICVGERADHYSSERATGVVYVFTGLQPGEIDTSQADATITAGHHSDELGYSIAQVGDANGDGYDDLLVGARGDGYYEDGGGVI